MGAEDPAAGDAPGTARPKRKAVGSSPAGVTAGSAAISEAKAPQQGVAATGAAQPPAARPEAAPTAGAAKPQGTDAQGTVGATANASAVQPAQAKAERAAAAQQPDSLAVAAEGVEEDELHEGGDEEEGEIGDDGDGEGKQQSGTKKLSLLDKCLGRKPEPKRRKRKSSHNIEAGPGPLDKARSWELKLEVRGFTFVGSDKKVDAFFAVSIRHQNPKVPQKVKLLQQFTPAYILERNVRRAMDLPITLYDRKHFNLSYKQAQKHVLCVDMWKVNKLSFNRFYGQGKYSLWNIAKRDPNLSLRIREKLTEKDEAEKKKAKRPLSDYAIFECTVNLEELLDFHLHLENWSLDLKKGHPDYKARYNEKKSLTFVIPRKFSSFATTQKDCNSFHTKSIGGDEVAALGGGKEKKFFWQKVSNNTKKNFFRGTKTSLENSFFCVMAHSGRTKMGACVLGLISVLRVAVFKGLLKDLREDEDSFNVGTISGSVKAVVCSLKEQSSEEIPGGRPQQLRSALSVTHLTKMRYLVVRVTKCEGLAVADTDTSSSDPYLRASWDNMVQLSPVLEETTAPVFNFTFFFPVRCFSPKVEKRRYQETALLYELKSKGDISIQVWDDDQTSADCLGFVRVTMRELLVSKLWERRTLKGKPKNTESDEDADEMRKKPLLTQWYDREEECRIFDGNKVELRGCPLPNSQTALIFFEAHFYPEFNEEVGMKAESVMRSPLMDESSADKWKSKEKAFDRENLQFSQNYAMPFPDSIGARPCKEDLMNRGNLRRFPCVSWHPQTLDPLPLMAFLVKIITDEEYAMPALLLHWMNCITWSSTSSQSRSGLIPAGGWKDPQYFLFTRKGPAQDHALLLCSILLGSGRDAYVCKGTIWTTKETEDIEDETKPMYKEAPKLVEHVWVMTREPGGWVTFWEPCTRDLYHLPNRWRPSNVDPANPAGTKGELAPINESKDAAEVETGDSAVEVSTFETPDMAVVGDDIDNLPMLGSVQRRPKAKAKVSARDKLKAQMIEQRATLPIAPQMEMLTGHDQVQDELDPTKHTFVDWLPYDSIDVLFNMENVWANHQNHHPACIRYDFEKEARAGDAAPWSKLLKDDEERNQYRFDFINTDVIMDPALKRETLSEMEVDMINEMEENMRLYRQKRGFDTWSDKRPDLLKEITIFLDIQEQMRHIDVDLAPIWRKTREEWRETEKYLVDKLQFGRCKRRYNRYGTPFDKGENAKRHKAYIDEQTKSWDKLLFHVRQLIDGGKTFPTRKAKEFSGIPIHFSTVDKDSIRGYLMKNKQYKEILERSEENLEFTVHCKIFGLLGGVQSCWLYFGVQSIMPD
mmetsp:Transcript_8831/g.16885  ORF Transcript_8831/g.16885 Transcript_8831/m.16885 type:complete len:1327 (+) Transcript_8831:224-4204(+)|eukprot:CAMPEP_0172746690 /NCGR_PEP_ID=MMETSP1074-20121228/141229_1 /TAXON_ID=2916 /ORGANISM="Ceratium fusus, Strain PA161109" /LENGTH=1326 /DNA_ID=CAMNT_0013578101 /DNA_START=173 /DNA_END=4153 /DNA_ORIENTATION=-